MCFGHILISSSLNKQGLICFLKSNSTLIIIINDDCSFTSLKANRKTVIVTLLQHIFAVSVLRQ